MTCSTCGRNVEEPRIVRIDGAIYEGCVDISHEPHVDSIPDYRAWVDQARRAGISGRC